MTVPFPVSFSRMQMAECPLALWNRIHNIPSTTPEASFLTLGSEVHACYDYINKNAYRIDDDLLDEAMRECVHRSSPVTVRQFLLKYIKTIPMSRIKYSELPLGLTEDFKPCDFDSKECAYRGIIDLVMETDDEWADIDIVDAKTSFQMYAPDTVQLDFYTWMFNLFYPTVSLIRRGIYFGRYGKLRFTNQTQHNYRNLEHSFKVMAERTWAVAYKFPSNGKAPDPCPGAFCSICNWSIGCPAAQKSIYAFETEEEASEAARVYVAKKNEVSLLSKKLKDWSNQYGDINVSDDSVLTNVAQVRRTISAHSVLKYLMEHTNELELIGDFVTIRNDILPMFPEGTFTVKDSPHTKFQLEKRGEKRKS